MIEMKKAELEVAELMSGATREEIALRNAAIEKIREEIHALEDLGTVRDKTLRQFYGENLQTIKPKAAVSVDGGDQPIGKIVDNSELNKEVAEKYRKELEDMGKATVDVSQLIGSSLSNMAVSFGEAFADMISGSGNFKSFLNSMLVQMANFVKQFGELMIAQAMAAIALKKLLMDPVAALAAGVALVAVGAATASLIKNGASSMPSYAWGTNNHPGGNAWVGEYGPELVSLPRGAGITPNHKIKSIKDRTITVNVSGEWILQNNTLRLAMKKAQTFRDTI